MSRIYVQTKFGEVFDGNPNVRTAGDFGDTLDDAPLIDLDMAYENRPMTHIVRAYEEVAREVIPNLGEVELRTDIFPSEKQAQFPFPYCVIHCDKTDWPGKNFPEERMDEVCTHLVERGLSIIRVGKVGATSFQTKLIDFRGKTNIGQLAAIMAQASLFIGIDSFPMHCAQAMGVPTIGLFGVSSPEFIMTDGSPHIGIVGDRSIPCCGQRHREPGKTFISCDPACIKSITVDQIISAVEELTGAKKPAIMQAP